MITHTLTLTHPRSPADYGALPVHAGLWDIGAITRESLAARLAFVPLVQEARGLGARGSDARAIIATNNSSIIIESLSRTRKFFRGRVPAIFFSRLARIM